MKKPILQVTVGYANMMAVLMIPPILIAEKLQGMGKGVVK